MIYLSGVISGSAAKVKHPRFGYLITPDRGDKLPRTEVKVAADTGCFTNLAGYSDERYMRLLVDMPVGRTIFATAPDVLGDHLATARLAIPVLRLIRARGLPAAFIAQDGWEERSTPWDEFDVLFVGGSTGFKFRAGREAVRVAKWRGKRTHMGRVNSLRRLRAAASIGCDSVDGTFLRFAPDVNIPRLLAWLTQLDSQSEMVLP